SPLLRIAVLGEVRSPSLYAVDPTHTLADLLALAGGFTPSADRDRVLRVRDGAEDELSGEEQVDLAQGLRSGDQIVVVRRSWFSENAALLLSTGVSITVAVLTALILR